MPELVRNARPLNRDALIVGSGPSVKDVPWEYVWKKLATKPLGATKKQRPDLVLINRRALGKTVPSIAVAVDAGILMSYHDAGLHEKSAIVTNHLDRVVGPDLAARAKLAGLLGNDNFHWAPKDNWPPLASGPLAAWVCAALGYRQIFLFGLDGGLTQVTEGNIHQENKKARLWDLWTSRFTWARHDLKESKFVPQLIRVWGEPRREWLAGKKDPLQDVLHATTWVRPPKAAAS